MKAIVVNFCGELYEVFSGDDIEKVKKHLTTKMGIKDSLEEPTTSYNFEVVDIIDL